MTVLDCTTFTVKYVIFFSGPDLIYSHRKASPWMILAYYYYKGSFTKPLSLTEALTGLTQRIKNELGNV